MILTISSSEGFNSGDVIPNVVGPYAYFMWMLKEGEAGVFRVSSETASFCTLDL